MVFLYSEYLLYTVLFAFILFISFLFFLLADGDISDDRGKEGDG